MDLRDSGDELMPTKCPHSSPSNLQDKTSARLLTPPFHGGAESRGQMGAKGSHVAADAARKNPLCKHAAPASERRSAVCKAQSLLSHSHDNSPLLAATVCTELIALISGYRVFATLAYYCSLLASCFVCSCMCLIVGLLCFYCTS